MKYSGLRLWSNQRPIFLLPSSTFLNDIQISRYYIQSTITLKKIYILLVNNSEGIKVMSIAHDTRILMSFNVVNYTETLLKKHII